MAAWPLSHRLYLLATAVAAWAVLGDLAQPCDDVPLGLLVRTDDVRCGAMSRGDLALPVTGAWLLASLAMRRSLQAHARLLLGR